MANEAVGVQSLGKRFRYGEPHRSVLSMLHEGWRVLRGDRSKRMLKSFWALRDVTFEARRGEALGLIGPNGAGKSTMLKLLAGILTPDEGTIRIGGRLAALIEVGAGFHGDLTGRENIFLNGAILGMSRREIRGKLDAIAAFAGLERFLDTPVKRYSSGMYARLGFSIAAHVDPDVLLVDEVLSVGDAVFRLRCLERIRGLLESGATVVFVTHHLDQMQAICRRAVVLNAGHVAFQGSARDAAGAYLDAVSVDSAERPTDIRSTDEAVSGSPDAEVIEFRLCDPAGQAVSWVRWNAALRADLRIRVGRPIRRMVVELNLRAGVGDPVLSINSGRSGEWFEAASGEHTVSLHLEPLRLQGGYYAWSVRIWDADRGTTLVDTPFRYPLVIDDEGRATGRLCVGHTWSMRPHDDGRENATRRISTAVVSADREALGNPVSAPPEAAKMESGRAALHLR